MVVTASKALKSRLIRWPNCPCQTDPDFLTNREDIQTLPLRHQFIQQAQENDYATVETNMDSVIDTVIQAFLNDASLGGTADGRISRQAPRPSFLGR